MNCGVTRSCGYQVDVWNLRRCAAYTLDALARYFKNTLLAALLPELNARFACNGDSQWLVCGFACLHRCGTA